MYNVHCGWDTDTIARYSVVWIQTILPGTVWLGYRHYFHVQCGGDTDTIARYSVVWIQKILPGTVWLGTNTIATYSVMVILTPLPGKVWWGYRDYCQVQCGGDTDTFARYSVG